MATHTGHSGVVTVGTSTMAEVKDFSIEITANTVDATTMVGAGDADEGWTRTKVTNRSWTASINCFFDDAATNGQIEMTNNINQSVTSMLANAGVDVVLEGGGDTYTGTALVTSVSKSVAGDGLIEVSFTATGIGKLTVT